MSIFSDIKLVFGKLTVEQRVEREHEEARIDQLAAFAGLELAQARLDMTTKRVERLQKFLQDFHQQEIEKAAKSRKPSN